MRLTIIPEDKSVYVDGISWMPLTWTGTPEGVHALQWFDVVGWIEFKDKSPNEEITVLPDWAMNAYDAWVVANTPKPPQEPTAEENKMTAQNLLYSTDWSTIPDVSDPARSNPYLTNVDEFIAFRNQVRPYAINPVAGVIDFPTPPKAIWSA